MRSELYFLHAISCKAFDKVWYRGLLSKLIVIWVLREILFSWFASYISNRKQRVIVEGVNSDWCNLKAGVPQVSILEPLSFCIYILLTELGILSILTKCFYLLHDNCFLLEEIQSPNSCVLTLNNDLSLKSIDLIMHPPLFMNNVEI